MLRIVLLVGFALVGTQVFASDVGLLRGVQASVISPCGQLLVTGQFLAPKDLNSIELRTKGEQASVTVLELEVVTKVSNGVKDLHLIPFSLSVTNHSCPYGVSVSFGDQNVLVGVNVAQVKQEVSR